MSDVDYVKDKDKVFLISLLPLALVECQLPPEVGNPVLEDWM